MIWKNSQLFSGTLYYLQEICILKTSEMKSTETHFLKRRLLAICCISPGNFVCFERLLTSLH